MQEELTDLSIVSFASHRRRIRPTVRLVHVQTQELLQPEDSEMVEFRPVSLHHNVVCMKQSTAPFEVDDVMLRVDLLADAVSIDRGDRDARNTDHIEPASATNRLIVTASFRAVDSAKTSIDLNNV